MGIKDLSNLVNNYDGDLHDLAIGNNWSQVASYNDDKTSGISFAPSIEYQSHQIVDSLQAAKDAVK